MNHLWDGLVLGERFRLVAPLRPGGSVWRAVDETANREVAVKALASQPANDVAARARFLLTARTATEFVCPGIAQVYDYGLLPAPDGFEVPYLARELVPGRTLEERLEEGSLQVEEALRVVAAAAETLADAHRAGVVHGHLVPANIVLGPAGMKVTDLGLWALRDGWPAGPFHGVLSYVAPEQLSGGPATPASDMYSLGVVFLSCLTGIAGGDGMGAYSGVTSLVDVSSGPGAGVASLWGACLGASPLDRPSAAHAAVISREMISAVAVNADQAGEPPYGGVPRIQPATPPTLSRGGTPAPPADPSHGTGQPGPGHTGHRQQRRWPTKRGPRGGSGPGPGQSPGTRGGYGQTMTRRDGAVARRGGVLALGGAATGVTVAVLVVLARFVSPDAAVPQSEPSEPAAHLSAVASDPAGQRGTAPSPDATSPAREVLPPSAHTSPSPGTPSPGTLPPPKPTPSAPAGPRGKPTTPASPDPRGISPQAAISDIQATLANGVSTGAIRPDVAQDFTNFLTSIQNSLGSDDPAGALAVASGLGRALQARVSAGSVSRSAARTLRAEFTTLVSSIP